MHMLIVSCRRIVTRKKEQKLPKCERNESTLIDVRHISTPRWPSPTTTLVIVGADVIATAAAQEALGQAHENPPGATLAAEQIVNLARQGIFRLGVPVLVEALWQINGAIGTLAIPTAFMPVVHGARAFALASVLVSAAMSSTAGSAIVLCFLIGMVLPFRRVASFSVILLPCRIG
jgi:hypothetical protein